MATEGYAAVTSRRVAAEAGLNRALVHYYFHTMDDLFVALLRHQAEQGLATQAKALKSDQPLWALWDLYRGTDGTAITMEFVALATTARRSGPRSRRWSGGSASRSSRC
jgi:TetR/AcrR family transcriptional regulator